MELRTSRRRKSAQTPRAVLKRLRNVRNRWPYSTCSKLFRGSFLSESCSGPMPVRGFLCRAGCCLSALLVALVLRPAGGNTGVSHSSSPDMSTLTDNWE